MLRAPLGCIVRRLSLFFCLFLTFLACGLCSTTNDLAVYMETPNFESALVACFLRNYSLTSVIPPTPAQIGASVLCMAQDVGFTIVSLPTYLQLVYGCKVSCTDIFFLPLKQPCAPIWVYNTLAIFANCLPLCISFISGSFVPNDSDCKLNPCLECDFVESLSTFTKFAGRRRGLSGILTGTVRNCTEFVNIEHEACSTKFKKSDYSA